MISPNSDIVFVYLTLSGIGYVAYSCNIRTKHNKHNVHTYVVHMEFKKVVIPRYNKKSFFIHYPVAFLNTMFSVEMSNTRIMRISVNHPHVRFP